MQTNHATPTQWVANKSDQGVGGALLRKKGFPWEGAQRREMTKIYYLCVKFSKDK